MVDKSFDSSALPRISFCTACMGRVDQLRETLARNLEITKDYPNVEFVVLAYGDPRVVELITKTFPEQLASGRIRLASTEAKYWGYSTAKNFAARVAVEMAERDFFKRPYYSGNLEYLNHISHAGLKKNGDKHIIVNLDADNLLQKDLPAWLAETLGDNDKLIVRAVAEGAAHPINGCGGLVACRKELFYTFGGYDQTMDHWSGEDQDLTLRVVAGGDGYAFLRIPKEYVGKALPHNSWRRTRFQTTENRQRSEEILSLSDEFTRLRRAGQQAPAIQKTIEYLETPKPGLAPVANIESPFTLKFGCGDVTLYNATHTDDGIAFQEYPLSMQGIVAPDPTLTKRSLEILREYGHSKSTEHISGRER